MSERPQVSVILPLYNGERLVGPLVADIRRTKLERCEIVAVDDGSTDGTVARCEALGVDQVVKLAENSGPSVARNRGAAAARADIIVFVDSDVRLPEGSDILYEMWQVFERDPGVDIINSPTAPEPIEAGAVAYNNSIYHQYYTDRILDGRDTFRGPLMFFCSRMGAIRRESFRRTGGFHEGLRKPMNEDGEFWTRIFPLGLTTFMDRRMQHLHLYPTRFGRFIRSFNKSARVQYFIDRKMDTAADPTVSASEKARRLLALGVLASPLSALVLGPAGLVFVTLPVTAAFVASFGPMNRLIRRHVPPRHWPGFFLAYVAITPFALAGYLEGMVRHRLGERPIDGPPSADPFFADNG